MMKWPQHTTFKDIWGKIDFGEDGCVKPKTNKFQYFFYYFYFESKAAGFCFDRRCPGGWQGPQS